MNPSLLCLAVCAGALLLAGASLWCAALWRRIARRRLETLRTQRAHIERRVRRDHEQEDRVQCGRMVLQEILAQAGSHAMDAYARNDHQEARRWRAIQNLIENSAILEDILWPASTRKPR